MKTLKLGFLCLLILFWAFALPAQQPGEPTILQTDKKIVIDGNLDEWAGVAELPVDLLPDGQKLPPAADFAVTAMFTFGPENFYVAVKAKVENPEFPDLRRGRGFPVAVRQPGQGFLLTFVDAAQGNESEQFLTFGFSKRGSEEVKFLANREAEFAFPETIGDVQIKILVDPEQKSISYEAAVPWKYVPFFRPFLQKKCALNLVYTDADKEQRKVVQLFADANYDSRVSKKRKGLIFNFISHPPTVPEFQSLLEKNHFSRGQANNLLLAVNSPEAFQGWEVRFIMTSRSGNISSKHSLSFEKGMNILRFPVETGDEPSGLFDLSLGILDDKGVLRFTDDSQFFLLNEKDFEAAEARLAEIRKGELYQKDALFRESLPTLEIRLKWIKESMGDSSPFIDIDSLHEWNREMRELFESVDAGRPALFPPGRIARLAYRSGIDDTLQPFSVLIPADYGKEKEKEKRKSWPLLVTLHDAGVDDSQAIAGITLPFRPGKKESGPEFIILAPLARGLSDWYVGESGREVMECINKFKRLYNVDEKRVAIDGFGMGGYGAWLIALLHPEMFKAVVVRSGRTTPPKGVKGEDVLNLLDRGKGLDFLIVQGTEDKLAPLEDIKKAVARMEELKIRVKFIEIRGAGHRDYNKWPDILNWLKDVIGK